MDRPDVTVRVVADFNAANFVGLLENDEALPHVRVEYAGLAPVVPALLDETPTVADAVVVWTRPEATLAGVQRLVEGLGPDEDRLAVEVDAFASALSAAASRARLVLVATWVPPAVRGRGFADLRPGGVAQAVRAANARLAARLGEVRNLFLLDADRWMGRARNAEEPRLWFMAKVPYSHDVFTHAVGDVKAALRGISGQARKVVVVDLDDTIWGGLVGEVGWEALRVGGHDPTGEAYATVQRHLQAIKRRGILLAIASKNDAEVALQALDRHPEMILRRDDFSAWRIHWGDKAQSLLDLAAELGVDVSSLVFLDDSPAERARIRSALPTVLVPELPADKLLVPAAIAALDCFDVPALTEEDTNRAAMMSAGRHREALRERVGTIDDWLATLETEVTIEALDGTNLVRAAQLLNKTNQLNLTTRRLTEDELWDWSERPECKVLTFRLADRFGDLGLTGLLGVEAQGPTLRIVDFVLSCRVIGRRMEELMVHAAVEIARHRRLDEVVAQYLPTPKNGPCLQFWLRSAFVADGELFRWSAREAYPRPGVLRVRGKVSE